MGVGEVRPTDGTESQDHLLHLRLQQGVLDKVLRMRVHPSTNQLEDVELFRWDEGSSCGLNSDLSSTELSQS